MRFLLDGCAVRGVAPSSASSLPDRPLFAFAVLPPDRRCCRRGVSALPRAAFFSARCDGGPAEQADAGLAAAPRRPAPRRHSTVILERLFRNRYADGDAAVSGNYSSFVEKGERGRDRATKKKRVEKGAARRAPLGMIEARQGGKKNVKIGVTADGVSQPRTGSGQYGGWISYSEFASAAGFEPLVCCRVSAFAGRLVFVCPADDNGRPLPPQVMMKPLQPFVIFARDKKRDSVLLVAPSDAGQPGRGVGPEGPGLFLLPPPSPFLTSP